MKKLFLLTLSLVVLAFSSGMAGEVSKEDAQKVAINAYFEKMNQYDEGISFAEIMISFEETRYANGAPAFYAFDFANGGFMIISAEDVSNPVIGYSLEGEYPKEEHAYVYASFLQGYVDQIAYIRENNVQAEPAIAAEWKHLLTVEASYLNTNKDPKDVDPLLTNMWNQDSPYNLMCPEDAAGSGGHVYVGCVATAMSMIMHYYRYPLNGESEHCYTPANPVYGVQCAYFEDTYYAWNGMKDNIDAKNPWPIAEIGYHCAVSVNMMFGANGSGAYSNMVAPRLAAFFRYETAEYLVKQNYSNTTWKVKLNEDIDISRPIYYSGQSTTGGHAFVCDGYQGSDYHFNFGWSGSGNGYYSLYNVGGYSGSQAIVRHFYPSDPAYPYHNTGQTIITEFSGQFTDGSGPIEGYLPNTDASWLIDPQTEEDSVTDITIYFVDFDLGSGDYLRIYDGETSSATMLGEFTGSTLPTQLTSTGNKMLITLSTDGSGEGAGFKAEFSSDFPTYCSSMLVLTDPVGTLNDGSGSFNYAPGATCMFNIEPPYATTITVTFTSFETEADKDVLKIYDGNTLLGTFSGDDEPGSFNIENGNAFITWSTNGNIQKPGWELVYEIGNVSVKEPEAFTQLDIFPNPATDALNINFWMENNQTVEMRLVNVTGDAVFTNVLSNVSGQVNSKIDVSGLAKGLYILNLTSAEGTVNKKLIIK